MKRSKNAVVFAALGVLAAALWAPEPALAQPRSATAQGKPRNKKPKGQSSPKTPKATKAGGQAAVGGAPNAGAGGGDAKAAGSLEVNLAVQRVTLENGLRVVLNVDRSSPTVAVAVTYDVGSRDEAKGRSGFAHLFEHLMFHGTRNLPKGEIERLVLGRGGFLSAVVYQDYTNYFMALPANELALALWSEADRMRSLVVTAEAFEAERRVVQEELRLRVSNAAFGLSPIRLEELVYQGFFPYQHPSIGSMDDLNAASLDEVKSFYDRHYGPNTAVLSISGDIEADEAMDLVHRYFDRVPRIEAAPPTALELPEQTNQRTAVLKDEHAATPGVLYGWAAPPASHADRYALELAAILLGEGQSSKLHDGLVRAKPLARSASASLDVRRGPSLFAIDVKLSEGARMGDVEKFIEAEIKALGARGPTEAELQKARRMAQARFVLGLQWNRDRAIALGKAELFHGDARRINTELARYSAVTKEDIAAAVTKHLAPTRRTIVETYPAATPEGSTKSGATAGAPAAARAEQPAASPTSKAKKTGAKKADPKKKKTPGAAKPKKKKP
ncbi:MAG TPA: pitrilysin family protein [Polyangiaceae bacterium]|nr:pitrilysin family protein [Polyangiaceae bacterium]